MIFSVIISSLLLLFVYAVYRLWWRPLRIQRMLNSQGIKGPSYKFFHGNTKEIIAMRQKTINTPMVLSHDILPKLQPHLYSWIKLYGNNFVDWIGTQPQLVVTDPELIKDILNNKEGIYPKTRIQGFFTKLLGDSIVVAEGEKWFRLRKIANHAFHGESLKDMIPTMVAAVESVLENWRPHEGKEIDVCEHFRFLTADVISRTAFGSNYLEGRKIFDMITELCVLISRNAFRITVYGLGRIMKSKDDVEADKLEKKLHDSIREIVERREDEVKTGRADNYGRDFLGSLLKSHHEADPKGRISASEIIDECKTFYFAGQETTYSLLSWGVLLLSIHTDWQDKARDEVFDVFGRENPASEGLTKLKIVNMILYETLRLYSPVTVITRRIDRDTKLGNFKIPRDTNVAIPTLALHHNPELWGKDAHLFRPERFEGGLAKATDGNPAAFLGFGLGPRMCVGMSFAINEAKIALSMILRRYEFTLSKNYVHLPRTVLTVQPRHGVQILLRPL